MKFHGCFILFLLVVNVIATDMIEKPASDCETTEGERKSQGTLMLIYSKVRENVKIIYKEVQYFKNIRSNYQKVAQFIQRQKDSFTVAKRLVVDIFNTRESVYYKSQKLEKIFDIIDHTALVESKRFSAIVKDFEEIADNSILIPNTDKVCKAIDGLMYSAHPSNIPKGVSSDELSESLQFIQDSLNLFQDEEYKVVKSAQAIAASAMANSAMQKKWAERALMHYQNLDSIRVTLKTVNEMALFATWLKLEQSNENNHKIRHSVEELKIYTALLAMDMYESSLIRSRQLTQQELSVSRSTNR